MKKIISLAIIAFVIIGYFTLIYHLNNRQNIIKREPKSIFQSDAETLQATITLYPTLASQNSYTASSPNLLRFTFSYPENWTVEETSLEDELILNVKPLDTQSKECIKIYVTKDNMPLLEAVNFNRHMLQKKDTPYFLKEAVEIAIASQPAHISKMRLNNKKPEEFVQNAVIVVNNTYTTIFRTCSGTQDKIFYSVLKSLHY